MLTITVPGKEYFDEEKNQFFTTEDTVLELEHSLIALSKWESKWEKPFLSPDKKTSEETLSYIQCMCLTPSVTEETLSRLTQPLVQEINNYIESKMSATWFNDPKKGPGKREIITAEIIYYWMLTLKIPREFETWHLSRLFTMIKVVSEKNSPKKKMTRREAMAQQRALNQQRRQQMGTTG